MDKMQMAHEWYLKQLEVHESASVAGAWEYADAMQAEADKRKPSGLPDALKEEWQPDWSQAPKWAKWWAADADGDCYYFEDNPEMKAITWMPFDASNVESAPSFGYTGNWKESLRERPE